jgi:DNA-binding XRE family transcriptional regulator
LCSLIFRRAPARFCAQKQDAGTLPTSRVHVKLKYANIAYAILAYTDLDCKLFTSCQLGPTVEKSIYTQQYGLFLATLRAARESAGLLQSDLAARLNVDQPFVSKCESGQRRLDFIEVREWCVALGMTLNELTASFEETIARTQKK